MWFFVHRLLIGFDFFSDKCTPHTRARWIGAFINLGIFLTRIVTAQGWYIVTYALGIYHLNLFIAFLTPKIDPALDLDSGKLCSFGEASQTSVCSLILADDPDGPALPTRSNEEFRPFIRRLPEFKFWYAITKSTTIALVCTFFDVFNVPVFWPILVMYFITLFCITMKRQIRVSWVK